MFVLAWFNGYWASQCSMCVWLLLSPFILIIIFPPFFYLFITFFLLLFIDQNLLVAATYWRLPQAITGGSDFFFRKKVAIA